MSPRHIHWWVALLLFSTAVIACQPIVKDGQLASGASGKLVQQGQTVGQTFTARDRGLNGIDVYLSPEVSGAGEIRLRLRSGPRSQADIAVSSLPLKLVSSSGFYHFAFPPQSDSRNRDYYLLLDMQSDGAVRVGTASGDAYLDGAFYEQGEPVDAQMAFRLAYDPAALLGGVLELVVSWLQVIGVSILLFILPGWALLSTLLPGWREISGGERIGLAAGLSVAVYPLLFLWTSVFGLKWGALYAWLPILISVAVIAWRNRAWRPIDMRNAWDHWRHAGWNWHNLTLVATGGLVIGVRFWVIRSVDLPMWGDSYDHSVIAQLLVDNAGLFDSWQPYAAMQTFTYHFGFHAAAAVFHWVSGMEIPQAVLWTGQIFNYLAVFAVYPLAVRVAGNRWAGVTAVLVAGLLSPMPMFYVNYGRYTQLAGQVVLPAAIALVWLALEAESQKWRLIVLTSIALSGLALTHYRILIFAAFFIPAFFLFYSRAQWRRGVVSLVAIGAGAFLLFLPWFVHIFAGSFASIFAQQIKITAGGAADWIEQYNAVGNLFFYLPPFLWALSLAALVWGLARREKNIALISLWWLLVFLAANPQWFRLPGAGVLSNFAVLLAAYIPAGVLLGSAVTWLVSHRWLAQKRWQAVGTFVAIMAIGVFGVRARLDDMQIAQSELATRPDIRAATWIRENAPPNATFLINSIFAYGGIDIVGTDGGWWLPLLARRNVTVPPLNYESEQGPFPDYREWINQLTYEIQEKGLNHSDVLTLFTQRGINYVYVGQRQGQVNYNGTPLVQLEQVLKSPEFSPVYHQDRVWVFEKVR